MKTLLLTKTFTRGGAATGARNLGRALEAAGIEVVRVDGSAAARMPVRRGLRLAERVGERLLWDAETHCLRLGPPSIDLRGLVATHRPDIVQLCDVSANTIRFSDIPGLPCPVVHRMSDFWPYHGAHHYALSPPVRPDLADRLLRRLVFDGTAWPHRRVAPSHWLAERLGSATVEVIRNAVAAPARLRPRGVPQGPLRLGFISAQVLDPRKGFAALPALVDGLARERRSAVELHIFGRFPARGMAAFAAARAVHHPPFSPQEVASVYETFDILLCPSQRDNSPNVVTEALAHGVPVIAQCGTGMDSYVSEDTGGLIDFHAPHAQSLQALAAAVERIAADYRRVSGNARAYAIAELSPAVIGERYGGLYQRLLSES